MQKQNLQLHKIKNKMKINKYSKCSKCNLNVKIDLIGLGRYEGEFGRTIPLQSNWGQF